MKKILFLLLPVFGLLACNRITENTVLYQNVYGFGDVVSGTEIHFDISDVTLQVTEDQTDSKWMHEQTIFFLADLIRISAPNTYETRIKMYEPVTRKAALAKSAADPAVYGTDAVALYQDWGSDPLRRYINVSCVTTSLKDSETPHTVDLVWDDVRSNSDTLYLELHHQGHGESYENEDYEADAFQMDTHYMRFDLAGAIPPGAGSSIVISLEWDWFETEYDLLVRDEPKHYQVFGTLELD